MIRYLYLLLRLHRLDRQGRNESDEADDIRDRMDEFWGGLNVEEQQCVEEVSAALGQEDV